MPKKLYAVVTCVDEKGHLEYWDLADPDMPNFVWAKDEDEAKKLFAEWVGDGTTIEQVRVLGEVTELEKGNGIAPGYGTQFKVTIQKTLGFDMDQIINESDLGIEALVETMMRSFDL